MRQSREERTIYHSSAPGAAELAADATAIIVGLIVVVGGAELIVRGSVRVIRWIFQPDKERE
jgi:hypothetical protein